MVIWINKETGKVHATIKDALKEARKLYSIGTTHAKTTFDKCYYVREGKI